MIKLRLLLCTVLLICSAPLWAQRIIPANMQVAQLKSASGTEVVLAADGWSWMKVLSLGWLNGSKTYTLAGNVRVRNTKNLFVPYGRLSSFTGEAVAVRFGPSDRIVELWVLNEDERQTLKNRAAGR